MKVLVIGNGGREHALVWKLAQSPLLPHLYCAPGNAGTAAQAENIPIDSSDIPALLAFARTHAIDFTVVGPELPLGHGVVDAFHHVGLPVFGPTQAAAQLESSKSFAKTLMQRHGIPTAPFQIFARRSRRPIRRSTRSPGKASIIERTSGVERCIPYRLGGEIVGMAPIFPLPIWRSVRIFV